MQRLFALACAVVLVLPAGVAFAQGKKAGEPAANQEIGKLLSEMEDSFNRGDAKALAACWTPGGEFVGPGGERMEGREDIEKGFQAAFAANKNTRLALRVLSLRVVSEGVALVDAVAEVQPVPASGESNSELVLVKRDGRWLIDSARDTIRHAASQTQHLKPLEWMTGDWGNPVSSKDGVSVQSGCDWTANRAFLIRKYKVEGQGDLLHGGTEIIGWDPPARRIRSWDFDSDGGFGESVWVQDGNRWLIHFAGLWPTGARPRPRTSSPCSMPTRPRWSRKIEFSTERRSPTCRRSPSSARRPRKRQPSPYCRKERGNKAWNCGRGGPPEARLSPRIAVKVGGSRRESNRGRERRFFASLFSSPRRLRLGKRGPKYHLFFLFRPLQGPIRKRSHPGWGLVHFSAGNRVWRKKRRPKTWTCPLSRP